MDIHSRFEDRSADKESHASCTSSQLPTPSILEYLSDLTGRISDIFVQLLYDYLCKIVPDFRS